MTMEQENEINLGECVVPVELVAVHVFPRVMRTGPLQGDRGGIHVDGPQSGWLAWDALLCLDLHRRRQGTGTNTGFGLYADCVDSVRRQVTNGRQQIVIHHLRVPRSCR